MGVAGSTGDWPAVLAIAGVFAAGWLLVGPLANAPVIDDWVYAWSVERLLQTGRLQILDISAVYPVAQILWGALFAWVLGFSFGALRASTVVLSALGCCAFYFTLRDVRFSRGVSVLAAVALALNQVFFALSFSFMTDAPFVAVSLIALLGYVRGINRRRADLLWAGSAAAAAAFLIRPIGIITPIAALAGAIAIRPRWPARQWIPPIATVLVAMAVVYMALQQHMGALEAATTRGEQLRWWFTIRLTKYARWNVELAFVAVLANAPLLLAPVLSRRGAMRAGLVALALGVVLWRSMGAIPTPLPDWQTWSLQDIGARSMIGGNEPPSAWSRQVQPGLAILGLITIAGLLLAAVRTVRQISPGTIVVLTFGLLQWVVINALWLYNDRYYLVLAPAIGLLAAHVVRTRAQRVLAGGCLVVLAGIAVTGTRDMLDVNATAAAAARALEDTGVPPWEIDAGWAVNGWRLYAHPEHLRPGADRRESVPFVTSKEQTLYKIVSTPRDGYDVARVIPLAHAWWQATDRLYVLRRRSN